MIFKEPILNDDGIPPDVEDVAKYRQAMQFVNKLSRAEIVELLEGAGIQCYDEESMQTLHVALACNIEDGTICPEFGA